MDRRGLLAVLILTLGIAGGGYGQTYTDSLAPAIALEDNTLPVDGSVAPTNLAVYSYSFDPTRTDLFNAKAKVRVEMCAGYVDVFVSRDPTRSRIQSGGIRNPTDNVDVKEVSMTDANGLTSRITYVGIGGKLKNPGSPTFNGINKQPFFRVSMIVRPKLVDGTALEPRPSFPQMPTRNLLQVNNGSVMSNGTIAAQQSSIDGSVTVQFVSADDPAVRADGSTGDAVRDLVYSAYWIVLPSGTLDTDIGYMTTACGIKRLVALGLAQVSNPPQKFIPPLDPRTGRQKEPPYTLQFQSPPFRGTQRVFFNVVVNNSAGYEAAYPGIQLDLSFQQDTEGKPNYNLIIAVASVAGFMAVVFLYMIFVRPIIARRRRPPAQYDDSSDEDDDEEAPSKEKRSLMSRPEPAGPSARQGAPAPASPPFAGGAPASIGEIAGAGAGVGRATPNLSQRVGGPAIREAGVLSA
eukprot:tig00000944_g5928.t1